MHYNATYDTLTYGFHTTIKQQLQKMFNFCCNKITEPLP